jgi:hypothetical protein
MNLVHCQPVQGNSRALPLGSIRISLRSVVECWCVIQIPWIERYQLGRYVPLCNAPLRSRFIAHSRLETPKTPGVHTYTTFSLSSIREPIKSKYICIYYAKFYLSAGYIHLYCTGPPSLHSRTRCTTKWTMLVKNPGRNTCFSLHKVIQTSPYSQSISSCDSLCCPDNQP